MEKNNEWKKDISLCILDTDIAKAYDHVTFELVERGLTKKGVPKPIIAAWLREWSQMKSTMCLNPETMSLPLSRGRSLLQGDPMAPAIFVASMDIYITGALSGNLQGEGPGVFTIKGCGCRFWLLQTIFGSSQKHRMNSSKCSVLGSQ